MFYQYGSVLCLSCRSSMRLITIVPDEAGVTHSHLHVDMRHARVRASSGSGNRDPGSTENLKVVR